MSERISASGLRTLGAPGKPRQAAKPKRTKPQMELADRAKRVLRNEFKAALDMRSKLEIEADRGGREKGRMPTRQAEKLRSIVARLEGMSRLAMRLGILTPVENRQLWAEAIRKGLYEGWR